MAIVTYSRYSQWAPISWRIETALLRVDLVERRTRFKKRVLYLGHINMVSQQ